MRKKEATTRKADTGAWCRTAASAAWPQAATARVQRSSPGNSIALALALGPSTPLRGPLGVPACHSGQQPPRAGRRQRVRRRSTRGAQNQRSQDRLAYLGEEQQLHHGVDAPKRHTRGDDCPRGLQPPGPQGAVLGHADEWPPRSRQLRYRQAAQRSSTESKSVEVADVLQQAAVPVAEDVDGRGHAGVQAHEGQGHPAAFHSCILLAGVGGLEGRLWLMGARPLSAGEARPRVQWGEG